MHVLVWKLNTPNSSYAYNNWPMYATVAYITDCVLKVSGDGGEGWWSESLHTAPLLSH